MVIKFTKLEKRRLGAMLKEYIKFNYITQCQFARIIKCSEQYIGQVIKGNRAFPLKFIQLLLANKKYEQEVWKVIYKNIGFEKSVI